jgi:uncharacterized protein
MAREALPAHIRGLLRKRAYARPVKSIELVQTHISWVLLVDDDVYKLKKPVNLGFVDFTTLEKRRLACEAEVRLNRRGCPGDTYLGVVELRRTGDAYGFGPDGGALSDYAVHMKRLPRHRMMDRLLDNGEVTFEMVGRLAARVAGFHRDAATSSEITRIGGFRGLKQNWRDNLEQMRPFVGRTLSKRRFDRISAFVEAFMRDEESLLKRRDEHGWIRDCHGDMRTDSVCFRPSGDICIYDCIEFNDAFRYSDTGLDIAFLAMDLDYRGRPDLSDLLIGLYTPAAGDTHLPLLLAFYKCYRACVRGKVESLLLNDPGVSTRQKAETRRRASRYFELAESYTHRRNAKGLVVVSGLSGSGKSILAGALASRLGAVLLSTDTLRRHLFPQPGKGAALDSGIYDENARSRVYDELAIRAAQLLDEHRPVVVDGTYIERRRREPLVNLARQHVTPLLIVECTAPDEVVRERQRQREKEDWTTSEGRWEVYLAQKARAEPPDEVTPNERISLDTTLPLSEQLRLLEGRLGTRSH